MVLDRSLPVALQIACCGRVEPQSLGVPVPLSLRRLRRLAGFLRDGGRELLSVLEHELYEVGIRLNARRPDVHIKMKPRGGVSISTTLPISLDEETIRAVLAEYRVHNAHVLIREDITVDELIDVLSGSCTYVKSIMVFNKVDMCSPEHLNALRRQFPDALFISNLMTAGAYRNKSFRQISFIYFFLK